jgi:hypothetical protein
MRLPSSTSSQGPRYSHTGRLVGLWANDAVGPDDTRVCDRDHRHFWSSLRRYEMTPRYCPRGGSVGGVAYLGAECTWGQIQGSVRELDVGPPRARAARQVVARQIVTSIVHGPAGIMFPSSFALLPSS